MCRKKKKKYIEPSSSDKSSSDSSDSDTRWIEHKAVVKNRRHGHNSDHHVSKCKKAQIVKVESKLENSSSDSESEGNGESSSFSLDSDSPEVEKMVTKKMKIGYAKIEQA